MSEIEVGMTADEVVALRGREGANWPKVLEKDERGRILAFEWSWGDGTVARFRHDGLLFRVEDVREGKP